MKTLLYIAIAVHLMYWLVYFFVVGIVAKIGYRTMRGGNKFEKNSEWFMLIGMLYFFLLLVMLAVAISKKEVYIFTETNKTWMALQIAILSVQIICVPLMIVLMFRGG
jgi:hypothetical protein